MSDRQAFKEDGSSNVGSKTASRVPGAKPGGSAAYQAQSWKDKIARVGTKLAINAASAGIATQGMLADAVEPARAFVSPGDARMYPTQPFTSLSAYKSIGKTRAIAERFQFEDPFYRERGPNSGATTQIEGDAYLNFASYDYLGLNRHPTVVGAAKAAIDTYGTSVSASRIVAGEIPLHRDLEKALAAIYGAGDALTFVSGHATNVATVSTVVDSDDLIVYDELSHNSLLVGAKLSGAKAISFRHNDLEALRRILQRERGAARNALIIVEGLYSMDGDAPDLPELIALKRQYGAWLMVDEAHALGCLGQRGLGSAEHFGIDPQDVDIWMGTLSKTLATCGGYIAGSRELIELLRYKAAGQVYSVGMSPPLAAAAKAALDVMLAEPERVARLRTNGLAFLNAAKREGLDTVTSAGYSVVPVMVGDIVKAGRLTQAMFGHKINVLPIIYPAVPLKAARLRYFITSEHSPAALENVAAITAEELKGISAI